METTKQSKEEYLKRYLSGYTEEKKKHKKKKKQSVVKPRTRIVDDDVDIAQLIPKQEEKNDVLFFDEVPQVAEIIDERPLEEIELEKYRTGKKWRMIDDEGSKKMIVSEGLNSRHDSESDQSPRQKQARHDSNQSPPRTGKKTRHDSDSDQSPPRKGKKTRHDSDSDQSPPRKGKKTRHDSDSDQSPPRRGKNTWHDSDSDYSPPRKGKNKRHDSDSDHSPPRKGKNTRHDSDSDHSPPRKGKNTRHDSDSDQSPPRRRKKTRHDSDSDQSPPRRGKNTRHNSDSDQSPPRKGKKTQHSNDSDQSPPRRRKNRWHGSDSELSPAKRGRIMQQDGSDHSLRRKNDEAQRNSVKSGSYKLQKTISGLNVGLQDASSMRLENEKKRMTDRAALDRLDNDISGKNASTVYRDKSGRKRDLNKEKLKHAEELRKQEEESKQFKEWGRGVAQTKKHEKTIEDHLHEMAKPFARYEGDQDLEGMLKEQERDGDPMLAFLKKKASKNNLKSNIKEKPKYQGRAPPPNRFNIPPGYRWDGVDRSNGFEKKYFERLSNKKAMEEVKYKWNVEDM